MKRHDRFLTRIALTLVLVAGVSCSSDITGVDVPAAPAVEQPAPVESSLLLGEVLGGVGGLLGGAVDLVGGVVGGLLEITGLISCSEQKYEVTSKTIGPDGGTIEVGKHTLRIPKGALSKKVKIKAEQMSGSTNSLRFSPEGLEFKKAATLTINYKNCENTDTPKAIVYTTEEFEVLEVFRSLDLFKKHEVTAPIDHFSRYAVAY
jgi:hypothetical protein